MEIGVQKYIEINQVSWPEIVLRQNWGTMCQTGKGIKVFVTECVPRFVGNIIPDAKDGCRRIAEVAGKIIGGTL